MESKKYGLTTAIAMIVGIVIGSGIFFKSDNILIYTNGSIIKGIAVFSIAAIGIIFGSLTIGVLASKTTAAGGIITYADEYSGRKVACAFGWFLTFVYYPALVAVLAWVTGVYICMLFGFDPTMERLLYISVISSGICFLINVISTKLGGYYQNISTIIKIVPLFLIAIAGLVYGDPKLILNETTLKVGAYGGTWLAALGPVAFSYDGWVVSTSIAHELKNSKKTLPLALTIGPIFVLIAYILYFVGISILIGPEKIMALGDEHVNIAALKLFGKNGAKLILIFIVVSVTGTLNGFILGFIRLPYSLALRKMLPFSSEIEKIDKRTGVSKISATFAVVISMVWIWMNYITQKYNMLPNSDVSEIPIVASYILYIILYFNVIKLYKKGEVPSFTKGVIIPILAIIGSSIIVIGGLQNPMTIYYLIICSVVICLALLFLKVQNTKLEAELNKIR